jgi:hypothetical protein
LDEAILFFERQLIQEMDPDDPWPGGERGHGLLGYAAYISDLLGDEQLLSALTPVLTGAVRVGRNDVCPCGRGAKYKRCCLGRIEEVERRVGRTVLHEALVGRRSEGGRSRFTVADILMADVLRIPNDLGELKNHPALRGYLTRALARPAFERARADQLAHFEAADAMRSEP